MQSNVTFKRFCMLVTCYLDSCLRLKIMLIRVCGRLRCLPETLLHFPCEAACVRLAGFKPPHLCQEPERIPYRPEWSMKAMLEMIDLLHGKLRCVVTV